MSERGAPLVRRHFSVPGWQNALHWGDRMVAGAGPNGPSQQVEAPRGWSDLAVAVVARRYFLQQPERRERSVRSLVERVTRELGRWATASGHVGSPAERQLLEDELAALVLSQRATFATPVWLNVGTEQRPVASACFILSVEDTMRDLLDWNAKEGLIFQQGAGSGVNLSTVRSSREPVSRGGLASGPLSFMRGADAWAASIRSGGRARRSARMIVLDADHPDVLDFIWSKANEEKRAAALIDAGYAREDAEQLITFQQGNHSVRVSDEFMRTATEGGGWALRAVTTGEATAEMPAGDILRACAEACWACGDPGLQFEDTINRWHTCPASGPITASNPCGEFLHVDNSACNLASINLLRFVEEDSTFDIEGLSAAVESLILAQDALVSGAGYPTADIERNAVRFRQLGLGYTNLGAALLAQGLPYDSDEARAWAAGVTALMTGVAYRRSAELAEALGPFAEFEPNRAPMLAVLDRHREHVQRLGVTSATAPLVSAARATWNEAVAVGREHGFRNAQTTLIPPAGTVSLMMDCETTGVEPYYSLATRKRFVEGGWADFECRALRPCLRRLGYGDTEIERLASHAVRHGRLADAPDLADRHKPVFQTAIGPDPISPSGHLRMVAAVQPFLSGGVSKTVNVPQTTTAEDIESIFVEAWRLGLKAVSVFRQGSKILQPLSSRDVITLRAPAHEVEMALELADD